MSVEFNALHLISGNESPSIESLKPISSILNEKFEINNSHYLISTAIIEDKYFWFYAQYGKPLPYSKTILDLQTDSIEKNPRTPLQVETANQLFGLYDTVNQIFYLSNHKKKSIIESFLSSRIGNNFTIKSFFKNIDEFCAAISSIKKIRLVTKRNIFNLNSGIFSLFANPNDIFGLGIAEDFILEANFSSARKTDKFIAFIKEVAGWKKECKAETLICIGLDDKQIETVFNIDTFIQKISISSIRDGQGQYDAEVIQRNLIQHIEAQK